MDSLAALAPWAGLMAAVAEAVLVAVWVAVAGAWWVEVRAVEVWAVAKEEAAVEWKVASRVMAAKAKVGERVRHQDESVWAVVAEGRSA